jgi:hypothetical protein
MGAVDQYLGWLASLSFTPVNSKGFVGTEYGPKKKATFSSWGWP